MDSRRIRNLRNSFDRNIVDKQVDKIFETGTSNLLFVKNNKIYSPKNKYYRGTNFKFYEKKFNLWMSFLYCQFHYL